MTLEKYPTKKEAEIIEKVINDYLSFIDSLTIARKLSSGSHIVANTVDLFEIVKADEYTVNELAKWRDEVNEMTK